jgi:hypothetical protein
MCVCCRCALTRLACVRRRCVATTACDTLPTYRSQLVTVPRVARCADALMLALEQRQREQRRVLLHLFTAKSSHLAARTGPRRCSPQPDSTAQRSRMQQCTEPQYCWRRHEQAAWRTSCARLCRSTLSACARKGSSLSLQMRWILVISMNDQSEIGSKSQRRNMANRRCGTSAQQAGSCG